MGTASNNVKNVRKWYYDACTLDSGLGVYAEILQNNRNHYIVSITSHLGIGEAHSNCRIKGTDASEAFIGLINDLGNKLELVGNDSIEEELEEVRSFFPELSITDAIHLATALHHKCEILKTIDPDLYNLPKRKVQEVGHKFGIGFAITKIEFKNK